MTSPRLTLSVTAASIPALPRPLTRAYRTPWTASAATPRPRASRIAAQSADDAERPEHEGADGRDGRERDGGFVLREVQDVGPPEALVGGDAVRERVGVHVGHPDHDGRRPREHGEPPRFRLGASRAAGDDRHHDDRAVDRPGDAVGASEDGAPRRAGPPRLHPRPPRRGARRSYAPA